MVTGTSGRSRIRGDFVTKEQLEVARNGAVQQASSRGKADRFALSSATKSPPDSGPGGWCEGGTAAAAAADGINDRRKL